MPLLDREAYLKYQREYGRTQRDPEKERERNRKRRADPVYAAKQRESKRRWREANKDRYLSTNRAYDAKQLRENPQRRISKNLRHRLGKAVQGKTKGASAVADLGMSINDFRDYIASKFSEGMSWDNYGAWELDHIRPLILFDLAEPDQARAACHYSNYQPLWRLDNLRKGGRLLPNAGGVPRRPLHD